MVEVVTIQTLFSQDVPLQVNDRKSKHFFVPVEELEANGYDLSISKYREIEYEEVRYEKPEVIKKKILELEQRIVGTLKELDLD